MDIGCGVTVAKAIDSLCEAGILEETSGRSRNRVYAYGNTWIC